MSENVIITGIAEVEAMFTRSQAALNRNCHRAVQVNAGNVKRDAQNAIKGHKYLPAYPYSITYDTHITPTGAEAEIGPDKDRPQGPLGNIIEYGTSKNAPLPHLGPALDRNADDLERGVTLAVMQALGME